MDDDMQTTSGNSDVVAVLSLVALVATAIIYGFTLYHLQKNSLREATEKIFREWWDIELGKKRIYFFREYLPCFTKFGKKGANWREEVKGLKEIEGELGQPAGGSLRDLCFFFDRVGWLGRQGL